MLPELMQNFTSSNLPTGFYLIGIFFLAFLQRSLHRFFYPTQTEFDTCGHLFCANLLRANQLSIPKEHLRMVRPSIYPFPFLYHYLFAIFPKRWEPFLERHLNPFLDALFSSVGFFIILRRTGSANAALFCACAYIFSPAFFTVLKNGTRTKNATPRLLGEILVNLAFFSLWFFLSTEHWKFFYLAVFLGSLTFLSSKFSNQALTFISIFLGLMLQNVWVAALPFLSFGLAFILSRGKIWPVFKNQIDYLIFYRQENQQGKMKAFKRNSLKTLFDAFRSRSLEKIALQVFYRNSFSIVTFQMPLFWMALALIFLDPGPMTFPAYFVCAGLIIFLLTNAGPLLFLGHAERYINHVSWFVFLTLTPHLDRFWFLWLIVGYGLIFHLGDFLFLREKAKRRFSDDEEKIIQWLKDQKQPLNLLMIPSMLGGGWRIVYETHHNWFFHSQYDAQNRQYWTRILKKHPFFDLNYMPEILQDGVNAIVVHEKEAAGFYGNAFAAPNGFRKIVINENINAYLKGL